MAWKKQTKGDRNESAYRNYSDVERCSCSSVGGVPFEPVACTSC
nr:MAG TPA: hypothetical protein [Caudoviricetes sp.]